MGQLAHFISLGLSPSLKEREGWDRSVTFNSLTFSLNTRAFSLTPRRERDWTRRSLRFNSIPPLSRRERDGTAQSHSVPSPPFGLRPEAVILDRAVFASLSRVLSNPRRGFSSSFILLKQKAKPFGFAFCFKGERGIRTLGPVTDSGFRDRPIRPLWHLSEVCII